MANTGAVVTKSAARESAQINAEKADLSKTLSFGSIDEDSSSTVSFDSEGLPIPKDRTHSGKPSASNKMTRSDGVQGTTSNNSLDLSGSKSYQDSYRESVMSPVDEDLDDDDGLLDDLLGGNGTGSKNSKTEK